MNRRENPDDRKKWREHMADFFELPQDLLFNLPRVTMIGNIQLYIENYGGIVEYSGNVLRLKIKNGEIIIKGKDLKIKNFFADEMFIEGEITSLEYL